MEKNVFNWKKMDNASMMYSSLQREEYSAIYRYSVMLKKPVDPEALQRAIDKAKPRFPGFFVQIRRGFFWYYFEKNNAPGPFVKKDVAEPCRPLRFNEDNGWLVRFFYYGCRLSVEIFHALADGAGTHVFFKSIIAQYLRELGISVPYESEILNMDDMPSPEEWEDAYTRHLGKVSKSQPLIKHAYQNIGTSEPFYTFNVTMGFIPVDKLKQRAKERKVSVSEYVGAVLMYVLMKKQKSEKPIKERPIALAVPVNLRALFPSKTLRNFILVIQPHIDPSLGDYSFDEIAELTHHYLRTHTNRHEIRARFTRNVKLQNNRALMLIPRVIKNTIMHISYYKTGVKPFSATMTNPGVFILPREMKEHISHFEVIQGQNVVPRTTLSMLSYENTMEITFSGTQVETDIERELFRFLVRDGVPVKIESNRDRSKIEYIDFGGEE